MIVRDDLNPAQPRDFKHGPATGPVSVIPEFPPFREDPELADRRVGVLLRPLSSMLCMAFALEAAWNAFKPEPGPIAYQVALANALFFFILRMALTRFELPANLTHPVASVVSLMTIGYAVADLKTSSTPWATTQLLIVLLVAGFMLASRPWFTLLTVASCVGWFWAAFPHLSDDTWVQMGGALLVTVIWATWFFEMRLRSLADFERRKAEEEYNRVLEETQFFAKPEKKAEPEVWCPMCKASPDAIIRHNGRRIIDANASAGRLLAMDARELEGMAVANVLAPEKRDALDPALRLGNFDPIETLAFRKDNARVPVQMLNGGITMEPGGLLALELRDLSEKDLSKERLREATARTQQLLRRQADLAALAAVPDDGESLPRIMELVVGAAHRGLPSTIGAVVALWDNHAQGFTLAAASAPGRFAIERLASDEEGKSLVGWLARHKETLLVPNVGDDEFGARPLYPESSVEAFAAFPLIGSAGVIGFLLTLEGGPREYQPAEIEFLSILAYRATTACLQVTLQEQLAYGAGEAQ